MEGIDENLDEDVDLKTPDLGGNGEPLEGDLAVKDVDDLGVTLEYDDDKFEDEDDDADATPALVEGATAAGASGSFGTEKEPEIEDDVELAAEASM